jgi:glutamine cyclotransferase
MKFLEVIDVNLDKSEMVLQINNKGNVYAQIIKYDQIVKIHCKDQKVKRLFRSAKVNTIEIHVKGKGVPFSIRSDKLKSAFDTTRNYLIKCAEKYNINIIE